MSRGIYITANDKVLDQAIALLKSIRLHDPDTPIVLIPYDDNYQAIAKILQDSYGVEIYQDLEFIDRLSNQLYQIFGKGFFARPNQFRKQACWFGAFDQFIYIDTDIVVFDKIIDTTDFLDDYDFICYDYQHSGGIRNVFTPKIIEDGVLDERDIKDIFNGGFWGAKKNLISEEILYKTFAECAAHPEYFDFSQKTSDQPIINYMILKQVPRRFNIVRRAGGAPGSWAGSKHFQIQGHQVIDPNVNQPLQYLHWAGIRIQAGCPYWDIWKYYRYLGEQMPEDESLPPEAQSNFWKKILEKMKLRF
ncbi:MULTISPECIES: Npun_R2821/Npun_R2822 family protein [unclassified Coleofasciculus]|uniref:Npun_R2821/Npun_R2822 family protein n=1 Tax=unclassified Coleofasciculus TaxID=2692782 RepID=UPI001882AD0F|nr:MULTISPECIES: Npun_R2821/Npun_R2822 family protein [unclassified Coleofasciculus]MBE9124806.1 methionine synthase [Coleofasciculus sp. LEGE 07081]MBE9147711.1 methionine synthase [Coleofasciculus sp. LEGE 07092]